MAAWAVALGCLLAVFAAACGGPGDGGAPDRPPPLPADQAAADQAGADQAAADQAPAGQRTETPDSGSDSPSDVPSPDDASPGPDASEADHAEEPADAAPQAEPTPSAGASERDHANLVVSPSEFRQPAPTVTVLDIPARPDAFADFPRAALPWLQGRTDVPSIVPLFEAWRLPPVREGARLHLVDTDGDARLPDDGRSALVIVFTDPPTEARATGWSNLVVYEPLPDEPGRFQLAYDHDAIEQSFGAPPGRIGVAVTTVYDVTGDGLPDIAFEEFICDASGCRAQRYVLSKEDGRYRRTIRP